MRLHVARDLSLEEQVVAVGRAPDIVRRVFLRQFGVGDELEVQGVEGAGAGRDRPSVSP